MNRAHENETDVYQTNEMYTNDMSDSFKAKRNERMAIACCAAVFFSHTKWIDEE